MMKGETVTIKARHTNYGETTARKISISKNIRLEELEYKLRERFDLSYDKKIDLYYIDEDNDRVIISFEDELASAMESSKTPIFEVVVKSKDVDNEYTYPQIPKGNPGECVEILIESQYLTLANATREDTKVWGTYVYTDDSDIIKILAHSKKVELPEIPPSYNIIVSLRFIPGNLKYIGTTSNGITSLNYGPYETSFIVENVRIAPFVNEKSFFNLE